MIIESFRTNKPQVYIRLVVYALFLHLLFIYNPDWVPPYQNTMIGREVANMVNQAHLPIALLQLLDVSLLIAQALLLNYTLIRHNIFPRTTYLPAFFYISYMSMFGEWAAADLQTIGELFIVLSFFNLAELTAVQRTRQSVFFTSLFLSIGTLFYFPTAYFIIVLAIGLLINTFALADIILLICGLVLPYYFTGIYYFYQDQLPQYLESLYRLFVYQDLRRFDLDLYQIIGISYMLLLSLLGFLILRSDREFKIVQQRYLGGLMFLYLVILMVASPIASGSKLGFAQLACLPCALFTAKLFESQLPGWLKDCLYAILLLGILFMQLYYFKRI
ncbi:MAG: hypothetical protein SGJ04_09785 [Bacteroidota bacterium]|nr:hypothetical protein [Bacteroidota bacterium]